MDYQCVVVYTVISPSTTIAPSLRVQLERALSRSSTRGCISWIKYNVKRLIYDYFLYSVTGVTRHRIAVCAARVQFIQRPCVVGCGITNHRYQTETNKELSTQFHVYFDAALLIQLESIKL